MKKDRNKNLNENDLPENIESVSDDEFEAFKTRRRTKNKKSNVLKHIIVAILILALVYTGISLFKNNSTASSEGKVTGQMEIEAVGRYGFEVFGKYIVTCNQNGIFAYNKNGEMQWKAEEVLSNPTLFVKDNLLLVTDNARQNAFVLGKNGKILSTVDFGTDCIQSSINNNGWVTAILAVKGYKAQIAVYDNEGKLKYTWNSANNDVISAELSDDNRILAVSQIDSTSSTEAHGVISMFDITTEGKPFAGINTAENVVSYLRWSGKNLICAGNKALVKLNKSGKELCKYEYPGEVAMFNAESDDVFAFAVNSNSTSSAKSYVFHLVNDDGKELGNVEISGDLKNIEISGNDIAAVTSDKIFIINKNGKLKNEYVLSRDISKGFVLDGGKNYFVISGTSAEILSLK